MLILFISFFVVVVVSFSNGSFPAIPQLQTIIQVADTVSVEMSEVVSTIPVAFITSDVH